MFEYFSMRSNKAKQSCVFPMRPTLIYIEKCATQVIQKYYGGSGSKHPCPLCDCSGWRRESSTATSGLAVFVALIVHALRLMRESVLFKVDNFEQRRMWEVDDYHYSSNQRNEKNWKPSQDTSSLLLHFVIVRSERWNTWEAKTSSVT